MNQLSQLISLVSNLTNRLNQIESGSKRIFELPETTPNGLSKIPLSRTIVGGEVSEYITMNAMLQYFIQEIQNIEDSTKLIQMLPPELLSSPRRIFIPTSNDSGDVPIIWKINGIQYNQEDDQEIEIPDANEDNYRKDLILGDENGQVILFSGIESEGGIIEPIQPENTVLLTSIIVFGDSVYEEPTLPINGSLYISKQSEQWASYVLTGKFGLPILPQINENQRFINITGNPTGLSSLGGYHNGGGSIPTSIFWDGMTAKVLNSSPNNQTIKHNYSGAAIKYLFPNEDDYTIRPNEVVYFDLKGGDLVFRYSTFLNAKNVFFDNTGTDLDSEEVEGAVKELNTKISTLQPLLTNEDWTLVIDENNVIWSNITGHTEYFKANGTDRNFVADFDFATIEVVYVNGVAIERNDYLILAENEIEIKENITLLNNTSVAIQGSIFIVEPTI